jgi:asparagine synthase (glutamine-hydrolysing)
MCGIAGIISNKNLRLSDIKNINDAIVHRGPDGEGYAISKNVEIDQDLAGLISFVAPLDTNVILSHRRLSIVDLSTLGHQPMEYKNRYLITYNGEIYNYLELREELKGLGYEFRSQTDTEVILAAYDAWGSNCLNRFNGMWSFLVVDIKKQKIFISRDRLGIKPFYYYLSDGVFVFASEIKAILRCRYSQVTVNFAYCKDYLENGCDVSTTNTIYKEISSLPPACFVECDINELCKKQIHPNVYWETRPNISLERYNEQQAIIYAQRYYDLLVDSVRLRLRADVEVGSALSGGLDSSAIVYLINVVLDENESLSKQKTFSNVYKSEGTKHCDESFFIRKVIDQIRVPNHQIEPKAIDVLREHEKVVYAMDVPFDGCGMAGWHTFKLVSQTNVKVTLDGQGADEQLAGYFHYFLYWYAQLPMAQLMEQAPYLLKMERVARRYAAIGVFMNILRRFLGEGGARKLLALTGFNLDPFIPLNKKMDLDLRKGLVSLIHYCDRHSMAHSIESRFPFLDYRLVEFLSSLPSAYKVHNGWTKFLARKAFDKKLPDAVVWRKDKMGYSTPEYFWFNGILKDPINIKISEPRFNDWLESFVDSDFIKKTKEKNNFVEKVRLFNLSVWHSTFLK